MIANRRRKGSPTGFTRHSLLVLCLSLSGVAVSRGGDSPSPTTRAGTAGGTPTSRAIRALEQKVRLDPENVAVQNQLAGYYLTRARETGDDRDIPRAAAAARASLAAVPAEGNPGGLASLALAAVAMHDFAGARDEARRLTRMAPNKKYAVQILGDAFLELGDYDEAAAAYAKLAGFDERAAGGGGDPTDAIRMARLALIRGDPEAARGGFADAVQRADELSPAAPTVLAWCHVLAGGYAFSTGDWPAAEEHYRAALAASPDDWAAIDHLAELRAAQKRYDEATSMYERLINRVPRPELHQALGDVYAAAGRPDEARRWHHSALDLYLKAAAAGGVHYYHHLAGYYSDAEPNPVEAVKWARKDLEVRHSIYAYDALAWALHQADDAEAASKAMGQALALGTKDAHLLYHASLIYERAGDTARARDALRQAAAANPKFNEFHVHR